MNNKVINFSSALNEAIRLEMLHDEKVISIGLGHNDPKRIFGTTKGLVEEFGSARAREMPISENAVTGVCVGMALGGYKLILTHQRVDFALLSMDQIVNSAAKWKFMFARQKGIPIVIRMIIGRGWGQGPTHSQSLQAWFAHIPGLKVVMPSSPKNAKGLLSAAIQDSSPVIFLEHRWLYSQEEEVPVNRYFDKIGLSEIVLEGSDYTVVASSIMVPEALKAARFLERHGVKVEVVDVRCLRPLDVNTIVDSVKKTGRLMVLDNANLVGSYSGEIFSQIVAKAFSSLKSAPVRLGSRDEPFGTSPALTKKNILIQNL